MKKIRMILRWAVGTATIVLTAIVCIQCILIYVEGNHPANIDEYGFYITDVYSAGRIAEKAKEAAPFVIGYVLLVLAALAAGVGDGKQAAGMCRGKCRDVIDMSGNACGRTDRTSRVPVNAVRCGIFAAALLFIVMGVINGGVYDVLVKAIYICTECIGLG